MEGLEEGAGKKSELMAAFCGRFTPDTLEVFFDFSSVDAVSLEGLALFSAGFVANVTG